MRPALFALAGRKRHSDAGETHATGPRAVTATDLRAAQLNHVFNAWEAELALLGGVSAETDIAALGNTVLDLTLAHPSGIAQLYAGRTTALASLVRDKGAYTKALAGAEAVKQKADSHAAQYGLPPTHLGLGIALWTQPGTESEGLAHHRVPVMLRPIALERSKHGVDLRLEPTLTLNPVLVDVLTERGIPLDPDTLAGDALQGSSFNPAPVLDAIKAMGLSVFPDFRVKNKLIVGVFQHPGTVLVDDLKQSRALMMHHPVVAALAGDQEARSNLSSAVLAPPLPYDRPPDHERGVGDLNVSQFHVLDVVASGTSVLVNAPANAPRAATLAAVVADAVGSGRSVLYVSGNSGYKNALAKTLRSFGLGECLQDLEPSHDWLEKALNRLVSGFEVEAPVVDAVGISRIRTALAERANQLSTYLSALHDPLPDWGVSPFDALEALALIAEESPSTRTGCQLERTAVSTLVGEAREEAKTVLRSATELGLFKMNRDTTPWFGADVPTPKVAQGLLQRLDRLRRGALDQTIAHMEDVTERTGLAKSADITGWGEQLEMLRGVRDALDQFIPEIFERSPEDMVAATATPEWREAHGLEMNGRTRRRLRKQARDLVRPGMQVEDLHQALVKVQAQREIWLSWSPTVPWPKLPTGMRQIEAEYESVREDLDALNAALAVGGIGGNSPIAPATTRRQARQTEPSRYTPLQALPFSELATYLDGLHADRACLDLLPQLNQLTRVLAEMGLAPLVEDLRSRQAGPELGEVGPEADRQIDAVVKEVDFAWWSSLLAYALADNPGLAKMSGAALTALVDSYRELDIAHTSTKPLPIRAAAISTRQQAAEAYPGQQFKLSHLEVGTTLRQALTVAPDVGLKSRPCTLAGPVMVPQALPLVELGGPPVDLVIIDGADTMTPAQAAPALARGKQVVIVGDSARRIGGNLTAAAGEFLPQVILPAEVDARDPRVTSLLENQGYATLGPALPGLEASPRITWTSVDGLGQVAGNATRIDAPSAEVEAAVSLVESHLTRWPAESVAVFTATEEHAQRIQAALEHGAKNGNRLFARALAQSDSEPLLVAA
ncbi:MAG: hypothetical protein LBO75_03735, partial [Bifidobacteriaceae bacterium]|nr:hypothetical protein [Bifidobacteriaceae bacterium]